MKVPVCNSKIIKYFLEIYLRLYCSNIHFNENSKRKQARTKEGSDRLAIIHPKANKGEKAIAKKIKESPTFSKLINKLI